MICLVQEVAGLYNSFLQDQLQIEHPLAERLARKWSLHLPGLEYQIYCRCNSPHVPSSAEDDPNHIINGVNASWCKAAGAWGGFDLYALYNQASKWLRKA